MTAVKDVFDKIEEYSTPNEGITARHWSKQQREQFRVWFKKRLKREPKLRGAMMDIPKGVNNTDLALERFTKLFVLNLNIEVLDNS